ncbi:hypothetical protein Clacol_006411 [Clathrus columnatus]|uniref:Uncharacterized protein n=1 Tax=Clathrus columnatus TaxID=1419009 RepID=A0AAV5AGZ9_9AGAM|nr:hypothetical protein Clacol_006411 [Clathrus columnatus]
MSSETLMDVMTSTSSSSYYAPTQTVSATYSSVTYGSGSTSWGNSECMAQFGTPPPTVTSPPSEEVSSTSTSSGAGATHTIIVAPSQGVLLYVPFATNASVGDTIEFKWGAGPHTVTQSSASEVCNKTANGFASGSRNAGSLYEVYESFPLVDQTINNTDPIWFYCGIPGHCEKGMFGGININNVFPGSSSNSSYMPMSSALNELAEDSDVSAAWNYTKTVVGSNSSLSNWGMGINCAGLSDENKKSAVLNVLYSQSIMAMNPDVFQNGSVVSTADISSLKLPKQFATTTNTTQPAASSPSPSANANGVKSLLAPQYFVALVAVMASLALF